VSVCDIHQKGNTTAYEELAKRVYVIGHAWGFSKNLTLQGGGTPLGVQVELKCLRAKHPNEKNMSGNSGTALSGRNGVVSGLLLALVSEVIFAL